MSGTSIYYQINRGMILNRSNYYYNNNKEVQRKKARNKHRIIWRRKRNKKKIMEKVDIKITQKKKKTKRISKKLSWFKKVLV